MVGPAVPPSGRVLTYLSSVSSPGDILGADGLLDALHFLLVAFVVPHSRLFGGPQGSFEGFHALDCGSQTLLQLGQLAA